jgi:hypothetical protein
MSFRQGERLFLAQEEVQHPATANMLPLMAAVTQNVRVRAVSIFQSVRKDGKAGIVERSGRKDAVVIGNMCQRNNGWSLPIRVNSELSERVANDVAEQLAMRLPCPTQGNVPGDFLSEPSLCGDCSNPTR